MNGTPACSAVQAPYVSRLRWLYIASELVIAAVAVAGNSLVCLAVVHNRRLRTVTNYFLVSLAVADVLVGLVAIPCAVLTDLGQPHHDLPLCMVLLSILIVLTQSSILSMLVVAAERYMAILLPFRYQRVMSPRRAQLALLLTWVMAALFGTVPLMDARKQPGHASYCIFTCVVDMAYMVYFNCFCCFLLPLSAMFVIYGHIFVTIRHQVRRIAVTQGVAAGGGSGSTGREDSRVSSSDYVMRTGVETRIATAGPAGGRAPADPGPAGANKARSNSPCHEQRKATSLFLVLFLFMVCWLPIHFINTLQLLCPRCPVPLSASLAAILLSHANSALNPILYAYRMRSFRRTLVGMWRGLRSRGATPQ